jgi:hypothetical protein
MRYNMKIIKQDWFSFLGKANTVCLWTGNMSITPSGNVVMGAGLAKDLSTKYPRVKHNLAVIMKTEAIVIDTLPDKYGNITKIIKPRIIMAAKNIWMFPVKYGWWEKADIQLIRHSCKALNLYASMKPEIQFVLNFPGIGAGGLAYNKVYPVIKQELTGLNIIVVTR